MSSITIGSNISSLRAQRGMANATGRLSSIFERLASGQRINKAGDDAAGLAISESLKTDARVFTQAIGNVNDGISALNIVQGAIEQLTTISIRQKELAEQSANGIYSLTQRRALNAEANALVDEFNRIIQSTGFNGIHLTDKSLSEIRIQAGYGVDGGISFEIGDELSRTVGTGGFSERITSAINVMTSSVSLGDVNGDGNLDMVAAEYWGTVGVNLGAGNAVFTDGGTFSVGSRAASLTLTDFNGDRILDIATTDNLQSAVNISLGNGNGTFRSAMSFSPFSDLGFAYVDDLNGDTAPDIVATSAFAQRAVLINNGNGTFSARVSFTTGSTTPFLASGDVNGDGTADLLNQQGVFIGNGDGTFNRVNSLFQADPPVYIGLGDLNGDGVVDLATVDAFAPHTLSAYIGNGDGSFGARMSFTGDVNSVGNLNLADLNGDGLLDIVTVHPTGQGDAFLGNGNGTFSAAKYFSGRDAGGTYTGTVGDLNGDGVLDVAMADDWGIGTVLLGVTQEVTTTARLNICTRQGALDALNTVSATLQRISAELGAIGSMQSRFSVALNTLATSRENFAAAGARILDADIAYESASLVSTQIVQQAASSVLAQANQQPALALQLLRA